MGSKWEDYLNGTGEYDPVEYPDHYRGHPSGVECIQITEHMNFCLGNAMKYIWRAGQKGDLLEDLKKARWYLDREIARLESPPTAGAVDELPRAVYTDHEDDGLRDLMDRYDGP